MWIPGPAYHRMQKGCQWQAFCIGLMEADMHTSLQNGMRFRP